MLFVTTAHAACPVCIVGVGGGLLIAEWLGVDDLLVAIWIMGLMCATSFWWAGWLNKKLSKRRSADEAEVAEAAEKVSGGKLLLTNGYLWSILMLLLTMSYFVWKEKLGFNYLWGIDRLILGSIMGMAVFFLSQVIEKILRRRNKGKAYFPFQKVIIPISGLLVVTGIGVALLYVGGVF